MTQLSAESNIKSLSDELTPLVRAALPRSVAILSRPFLWAVVRVAIWIAVAMFAPQVLPFIRFLLSALGPILNDKFVSTLRRVEGVLADSVFAPPEVLAAVRNQRLSATSPFVVGLDSEATAGSFRMVSLRQSSLASNQRIIGSGGK